MAWLGPQMTRIKFYLVTVVIFVLGLLAGVARIFSLAKAKAQADARDDDYENADDIRRRVSVDRADRVRRLDDAGYRD